MATGKSVFAGLKLSEQTALAKPGPDQRLFAPAPPRREPPSPAPEHDDAEPAMPPLPAQPRNLGTKEPRNLGTPRRDSATTALRFDFDLRPGRQANFVFTDEELEALEDLKTAARRKHGVSTTKQDIVRFAVIDLLTDYDAHGEESRLVRWLKQRTPKK
jgi:hypothetical protein